MDHVLKKGIWKRLLALLLCVLLVGGTMDAAAFAYDGDDASAGDDAPGVPPVDEGDDASVGDDALGVPSADDDADTSAGDDAPGVPPVDDDADDPDNTSAGDDAPGVPSADDDADTSVGDDAPGVPPSDAAPTPAEDGDAPASPERGGAEQSEAEGSASSDDDTDDPADADAPASPERRGAEQGEAKGSASSDDADASVGDDAPGVPPADDESAEKTVVYRFVVDGATVAEQTVKDGDTLDKPADPEKEGYTFLGWFIGETQLFVTDADSDGLIDPETVSVTEDSEDVTVTAAFEKIDATPSNAAASAGDDAPGVLPADADDGAPASPERGGAEQGEAEGSVPADEEPDEDDAAADAPDGEGGPKRGAKKAPNGRTVTASGNCGAQGDNVTFVLYSDGELLISGSGAMANYNDVGDAPWNDYENQVTKLTIRSGVTSIGGCAFSGCRALASVTIPSGVTSIGRGAFSACSALTSVTIPASVTSIGDDAFAGSALTSVMIPAGVTTIGERAFADCTALESVSIPNGVTHIGSYAFFNCSSLKGVTIPDSVIYLGEGAFRECSSMTRLRLSEGLSIIHTDTFFVCWSLVDVYIPSSVTHILERAFQGCRSITGVTLHAGISIDEYAFSGCDSLTDVFFIGTEDQWSALAEVLKFGNEPLLKATIHYGTPAISAQPASVSVKEGGTATFSVTAEGAESYQWQYRSSGTASWAKATAEGNKTATLKVPATSGRNGYQYRCKLTNAAGSSWSSAATLTVKLKPKITAQPVSVSVKEGGTATFTVEATGATGWQWQYRSSDSGSWANATAEGNKTATLKVPATSGRNGYQYRCKLTNANGSSWSGAATLTVKLKPVITAQPVSVTANRGETATFTVEATGAASYQWRFRSSSEGSWYNATAEGCRTSTLKVPATAGRDGYQYCCILKNDNGTRYTAFVTLTVR